MIECALRPVRSSAYSLTTSLANVCLVALTTPSPSLIPPTADAISTVVEVYLLMLTIEHVWLPALPPISCRQRCFFACRSVWRANTLTLTRLHA